LKLGAEDLTRLRQVVRKINSRKLKLKDESLDSYFTGKGKIVWNIE